jgi:nicotinate-nucleotide adenylyltransferase
MHVGILGGSFNPSHKGHCYISMQALKRLGLDQLWWVVTPQNPLKKSSDLLPLQKRLVKANDIISHNKIKVKLYEKSGQLNYSYLLVERLISKYPSCKFYWLIGADNLLNFHLWKEFDRIAHKVNLVVFPRNNIFIKAMHSRFAIKYHKYLCIANSYNKVKYLPPPFWSFLNIQETNISATQIRALNTYQDH